MLRPRQRAEYGTARINDKPLLITSNAANVRARVDFRDVTASRCDDGPLQTSLLNGSLAVPGVNSFGDAYRRVLNAHRVFTRFSDA